MLAAHITRNHSIELLPRLTQIAALIELALKRSCVAEAIVEQLCAVAVWFDGTVVLEAGVDCVSDLVLAVPDAELVQPWANTFMNQVHASKWKEYPVKAIQAHDAVDQNPILHLPGTENCRKRAADAIVVAELVRQSGGTAASFLRNQDMVDKAIIASCFLALPHL